MASQVGGIVETKSLTSRTLLQNIFNVSLFTGITNSQGMASVTNTDFSNSSRTRAVIRLDKTGSNNNSCIRNIKVEAL
jgi:hypothetical protein